MFEKIAAWLAHSAAKSSPNYPDQLIRYFLVFILLSLPITLLAVVSYFQIYQELTTLTLARREAVAIPVSIALEEKLDRLVDLGVAFSIHPKLRAAVQSKDWAAAREVLEVFKATADEPFIDRIFLADAEGVLRADFPALGTAGQDFSFRDWYQGVVRTSRPYISEVYQRTATPRYNVVAVALPVVGDDQHLQGILAQQIRLDSFLEWSKKIDIGQDGFVYVVDQKGNLVFHPQYSPGDQIVSYAEAPNIKKLLNGESGVGIFYNPIEKEERLTAFHPVSGYGWGVVVSQSRQAAYHSRDRSLQNLAAIYVALLVINGFLIFLILRAVGHYRNHGGKN
ncbi:MAG: cache domain-containing protein [Candidatus Doudnabacteria bacterium]|nr:cache domain-containing protein [Candidatus Doudnabacteria bacterium]